MKFFLDNTLPIRIAKGLDAFVSPEHRVVHFRERFAPDTADAAWMSELCAEPGWVILTCDIRIGRNPLEVEAWKAVGHPVFFLKTGWLSLSFWEQAHQVVKCFPRILETAAGPESGVMFIVSSAGKVRAE